MEASVLTACQGLRWGSSFKSDDADDASSTPELFSLCVCLHRAVSHLCASVCIWLRGLAIDKSALLAPFGRAAMKGASAATAAPLVGSLLTFNNWILCNQCVRVPVMTWAHSLLHTFGHYTLLICIIYIGSRANPILCFQYIWIGKVTQFCNGVSF